VSGRHLPLRLEGVGYAPGGVVLLADVSLRIEPGRRTVVMGPNGAGKSLLLRLCHGLLAPTAGRILCDGGTPGVGPAQRARQAMVFQRPVHLRRSALANLLYALKVAGVPRRDRRARALAALERFGLAAVAERPARLLSGGEQQRLALARAWLLEPELLLLDEPTSALDPAAARAVEAAVQDFARAGVTVVMTTHDLGQARRHADEVAFLARGRLVEHGPAAAFFAGPRTPEARAFLAGDLVV
jgi:tungstate transport system ATP-binding protein